MNDGHVRSMLSKYLVSYYDPIDHPRSVGKPVRVSEVPVVTGAELAKAMLDNVEEARRHRDNIRDRWEMARRDGLFDADALQSSSEDAQAEWIAVLKILQGDKDRCVSELQHWREYAGLALDGKFPTLKADRSGSEIVSALANAKQLPTTAEAEAEANEARRRIAAQLAPLIQEHDRRLPPERDDEEAIPGAVPF